MSFKKILASTLPLRLKSCLKSSFCFARNILIWFHVRQRLIHNRIILASLKSSSYQTIPICFQIVHASAFKFNQLYRLFEADKRFTPFVIICPVKSNSKKIIFQEYQKCVDLCIENNFEYVNTLSSGQWLHLSSFKILKKPHIVFLQNSWDLTFSNYQVSKWNRSLICYVSYFYTLNILYSSNYNKPFHKLLWKHFLESDYHLADANEYSPSSVNQRVVTGYPALIAFYFLNLNLIPGLTTVTLIVMSKE